jgi:hypothetical protein
MRRPVRPSVRHAPIRPAPDSAEQAREALRDYAEQTGGRVVIDLLTPLVERALDAGLDAGTIGALAEGREQ